MHQVAVVYDSLEGQQIVGRLREAGISATMTNEAAVVELYTGKPRVLIWIGDDSDRDRALDIVQELTGVEFLRCPGCGYNLQGHSGHSRCPECGLPVTVPPAVRKCPHCAHEMPDRRGRGLCPECGRDTHGTAVDRPCPRCDELVPDNFAVCWSCGHEFDEGVTTDAPG